MLFLYFRKTALIVIGVVIGLCWVVFVIFLILRDKTRHQNGPAIEMEEMGHLNLRGERDEAIPPAHNPPVRTIHRPNPAYNPDDFDSV